MEKKKMLQSTTITILLLPAFNNYGMDSKEKENNQETIQGETSQEKQGIKEEQNFCCEICQEINEEIKANPQMNKEEIWEQIEKRGIKIEKKKEYLKILFPEINKITKIKEGIFINFEMDKSEEKIEEDLDNIFTPFKKEDFIKNGTNLTLIKKSIFTKYKGKINYSFCIKPKKKINDIKIYFTCEGIEKKIYATFPEEKEKNKDKNGSDSIKNENKINIESINNENIEEKDENIEEKDENIEEKDGNIKLSQNISYTNNNIIIEDDTNKKIENFTIEEKGNIIKITFLNELFNKKNKEKIHFYCFPENFFTPYRSKTTIKNGTKISAIKSGIFNSKKENNMSIRFATNNRGKNKTKDYNIYFTIEGENGKFYADKIVE